MCVYIKETTSELMTSAAPFQMLKTDFHTQYFTIWDLTPIINA